MSVQYIPQNIKSSQYTNEELEAGIVEYKNNRMPTNKNGKILNIPFYELIAKIIGMRYWHITCTIGDLKTLLKYPIETFLNPDKERWYHYFTYENGFKKESEYKCWFSHKRQKQFFAMQAKWQKQIEMLNEEYHNLERMATMSNDEHIDYCKNLLESSVGELQIAYNARIGKTIPNI